MRKPCAADYANLCAAASAQSHPGAAMQCLKDNRDLLQEEACHEAVLGVIARTLSLTLTLALTLTLTLALTLTLT